MSLKGATIAVAGSSSGIGQAVIRQLAGLGAQLSIADKANEGLESQAIAIEAAGGSCATFEVDVRDTVAVDSWIEQTVHQFGKLDGAVNCAGVYRKNTKAAPVTDTTDEEWNYVIDTNLNGTFRCMRAQLKHMKNDGSLVNVTSVAGLVGCPFDSSYGVSKHGIIGLTRSSVREVASRGIRVNAVAPGVIDTPMLNQADKSREQLMREIQGHTPLNRMGSADEAAQTIVFLLSPASSFTTGAIYPVDGGMLS